MWDCARHPLGRPLPRSTESRFTLRRPGWAVSRELQFYAMSDLRINGRLDPATGVRGLCGYSRIWPRGRHGRARWSVAKANGRHGHSRTTELLNVLFGVRPDRRRILSQLVFHSWSLHLHWARVRRGNRFGKTHSRAEVILIEAMGGSKNKQGWPNPRLQRTPLRAPLSRKPLDGGRSKNV